MTGADRDRPVNAAAAAARIARGIYVDNARQTLADFERLDWATVTDRQLAEMTGRLAQCVSFLLGVVDGGQE